MKTPEEILKGLECAAWCQGCPYYGDDNCIRHVRKDAKELISHLLMERDYSLVIDKLDEIRGLLKK